MGAAEKCKKADLSSESSEYVCKATARRGAGIAGCWDLVQFDRHGVGLGIENLIAKKEVTVSLLAHVFRK